MQNKSEGTTPIAPRRQRERAEATRRALIDAARALFVARGYAATSTPDIVAAARVTRGALYHHYADKRDLFRAVLADETQAVAREIDVRASTGHGARADLLAGCEAYLAAMQVPGRTRLLLTDAPAVLGTAEALGLDEADALRTLREGLGAALREAGAETALEAELAVLLSAAFDRAALAIEAGADAVRWRAALIALIEGLLRRWP